MLRKPIWFVTVFAAGSVLAPAGRASVVNINNVFEDQTAFLTRVTGVVGFFPIKVTNLVDIPGTPWESTSTITELVGLSADSVSVSWTIQHLMGPHSEDINPNPDEPVTLSVSFTAAAVGAFLAPAPLTIVDHPTTGPDPHFDRLQLLIAGNVTSGLFGHLNISHYEITYDALHCLEIQGTACVTGTTLPPAFAPEPGTFLLVSTGLAIGLAASLRRRLRTMRICGVECCAKMAEPFEQPSETRPSGSGLPRFSKALVRFRLTRVRERSPLPWK